MELEQAMENRRSIRKYEAKPVETEKIRKMIQAAGLAPSWKNSQVTRYYVAQSEEAVAKVREALPEFNRNNTEKRPGSYYNHYCKRSFRLQYGRQSNQ